MVHPIVPLLPPSNGSSNVMAKKAIISTHGAQNSILFGEDGEGSLATSIVATTNEFNFQLIALQSLEFTNSGAPRSEAT